MSTATTYAVDATLRGGIIIRFRPHKDVTLYPVIHESFNSVYGIDLYDDEFDFLFDDMTNKGKKELFLDAPERLRAHMVTHIKNLSGATARGTSTPTLRL